MKLEYIKYFLAVTETKSFTRTAERCFVAQTAISRCISSMEEELNVRLFDRNSRHVTLTEAGKVFYKNASIMLKQYDNMIYLTKVAEKGISQVLRVGIGTFEAGFSAELIRRFHKRFPNVELIETQHLYSELWTLLNNRAIDIAFCYPFFRNMLDSDDYLLTRLFKMDYRIIVSSTGPLAQRGCLEAEDFSGLRVITLSEEHGPVSMERFRINSTKVGVQPGEIVQTNSLACLYSMVQLGNDIGFAPHFMEKELPRGIRMIRQNAYPRDEYFMLQLASNPNPAAEAFRRVVVEAIDYLITLDCES